MGDPGAQGDNVALRLALFAAFVAVVYGANWALDRYGVVSIGFGLMAPAGVYFAGVGFSMRRVGAPGYSVPSPRAQPCRGGSPTP
jgi:hypothetical protein